MMADQRITKTIRVDKELWRLVKIMAVKKGVTASDVVEEALIFWFQN